jgi:hypothetical protein
MSPDHRQCPPFSNPLSKSRTGIASKYAVYPTERLQSCGNKLPEKRFCPVDIGHEKEPVLIAAAAFRRNTARQQGMIKRLT